MKIFSCDEKNKIPLKSVGLQPFRGLFSPISALLPHRLAEYLADIPTEDQICAAVVGGFVSV